MTDERKCPDCGGETVRYGVVWSGRRRVQRYICKDCGRLVYSAPTKHKKETNENDTKGN